MARYNKGGIPWNKGLKHSEETKKKISLKNKGNISWNKGLKLKPLKKQTKKKMSDWHQKNPMNPMKGKKHTPEAIEKIRQASIDMHKNRTEKEKNRISEIIKQKNSGENNYNWKGGKYVEENGYIRTKINGRLKREHRLIMEKHLGRELTNNELVHHRNGIRDDNRIENLEIVIKKMHFGNVNCPYCLKEFKVK